MILVQDVVKRWNSIFFQYLLNRVVKINALSALGWTKNSRARKQTKIWHNFRLSAISDGRMKCLSYLYDWRHISDVWSRCFDNQWRADDGMSTTRRCLHIGLTIVPARQLCTCIRPPSASVSVPLQYTTTQLAMLSQQQPQQQQCTRPSAHPIRYVGGSGEIARKSRWYWLISIFKLSQVALNKTSDNSVTIDVNENKKHW